MTEDFSSLILAVVGYLGGAAVILGALAGFAYWLFKLFSEKWLAAKFEMQMVQHRHLQAQELERLKFDIQGLLDRRIKLQQKEFEVVPAALDLMIDAYVEGRSFTSPLQSYPDLGRMNDEQLEEFLSGGPLLEWQRNELRATRDRNSYYQGAIFWHRLHQARGALQKFQVFFLKNKIFMPPDLQEKFSELQNLLFEAILERELNEEMKGPRTPQEREKQKKMWADGERLREDLVTRIQDHLWGESA